MSNRKDPHWKQDFSVDWEETSFVTRREFTRFLGLGSVGLAVGSTIMAVTGNAKKAEREFPRVEVCKVDDVKPRGFKAFEYPEKGQHAILLRHEDGGFDAFSQKCPHLGCSVFYEARKDLLECPCHEGFFNAYSGDVISGPPQRGLARIDLELENGVIYAVRKGEE